MKKFNVILHITTYCNYNCSYCSVIKDKKKMSSKDLDYVVKFIKDNRKFIETLKFFGGEPLLAWNDIKYIIDNSQKYIGNSFEVVTNTSLLNNEIGLYFKNFFKILFFSIDSENIFNYYKVYNFVKKHNLGSKIYFNLIVLPGKEEVALRQFNILYNLGFRGFNILPVYITKSWKKNNLKDLFKVIKNILDLSLTDKTLRLYGFQENLGDKIKLVNNSIFINLDLNVYYSDIVSTFIGKGLKDKLLLGKINKFDLEKIQNYDFKKERKIIRKLEKDIYNKVKGQKELKKIMDYFSLYLNKKKGV